MKIRQHFYTRERRGLFRQSEGYDSIAKSPGLDDAFIKQNIHPYCTYSSPGGVQLTVVHYPCGKMLFGQAAYVPADFTGQRAAFFAHNYIIPPEAAGGILADGKLLRTKFETSYALEKGQILDELDALPIGGEIHIDEPPVDLAAEIAEKIINTFADSTKIYIPVPAERKNPHSFACGVLAELYRLLPEVIIHKLGFCTYAREQDKRKGINLVFLGPDAVTEDREQRAEGRKNQVFIPANVMNTLHGSDTRCSPDDFDICLSSLPPERFFAEAEFWRARLPSREDLAETERGWLEKNLDRLTPRQLAAAPSSFIKRGIKTEEPTIYLMLSILKKASGLLSARKPFDTRYFLGSYFLSTSDSERITRNLRRMLGGVL